MAENLLVPAIVHFNLGSKAVNMTDYDINVTLSNGSEYTRTVSANGKAAYQIQKGGEISLSTGMTVTVVHAPDKTFDDDIKNLQKNLEESKSNDPKKYVKSMCFSFCTNEDKPFNHLQFEGFVSDIKKHPDEKKGLLEVVAELTVYNPVSFSIRN
jgi:hypothetical protein